MEKLKLTKGKYSLMDKDDFNKAVKHKWCASDSGNGIFYAHRKSEGKTILLHRFIMGVTDNELHIDHINHDTLDNRRTNLRVCSQSLNNRNKSAHKKSTSKYVGVSWDKSRNKWRSNIYIDNKLVFLGRFDLEQDAAIEYDKKASSEFGEFANLNFK